MPSSVGLVYEVDCADGVVKVILRNRQTKEATELFPNGVCRRQFAGPKMCGFDDELAGIDEDLGEIVCRPVVKL